MPITEQEIREAKDSIVGASKAVREAEERLEKRMQEFSESNAAQVEATKEERAKYESLRNEVDEMMRKLQDPASGLPGTHPDDVKGQDTAKRAFELFLRKRDHEMTPEQRSLVVSDAESGGYLVPPERSSKMVEKIIEISPVRQLATVLTTMSDHLEVVKETGQMTASWGGEQTTVTEDTGTKFGLEKIPVHFQRALVKATRQMIADSAIDIEAFLSSRAVLKFANGEGAAFISGNGVTRPEGLVSTSAGVTAVQSTTAASGAFDPDDILDTEAAVISTYGKNSKWLMNRTVVNAVRKFKDSQNRYLNMVERDALKALEGMRQLMLDGYPLYEAPDMATLASAAKVGVFGDIAEAYYIVDRQGMLVIRDPYTSKTTGLVEYLFERRVGGQVVQPDAVRILQCKA